MRDRFPVKCLVLLILSFVSLVSAFDFSFTAPTSCDNLNISWSGGNGPFSLLITPLFNVPQNISIPDSAVDSSSGNGSFSVQLILPLGQQFLLTMSDSTGFESGGTSEVLTVGSSVGGASCNTTQPNPDFFFQLNSALQQCRTFTFSEYDNGKQPVRILGLIPLGQSFELDPPPRLTSFDWIADVSKGTSIVFLMIDAEGRQGGSSDLKTVGTTDDDSCISASSPHSTATATQTGSPQATETVQVHSSSTTAAIAGATVGGVALISLALLVSLCCFRRRNKPKYDESGPHRPPIAFVGSRSSRISRMRSSLIPSSGRVRRAHSSFDLLPPGPLHHPSRRNSPLYQSTAPFCEDEYVPNPYILPSEVDAADGHSAHRSSNAYPREPPPSIHHSRGALSYGRSHSRSHSRSDTVGQLSPVSAFSSPYSQGRARRPSVLYSSSSAPAGVRSSTKASLAGTTHISPRLILHTDAEDVDSSDEGEEVIELPPQYTDRRDSDAKPNEAKGRDRI